MAVSLEHKQRMLKHLEGQQALATLREAQALLAALIKPDMKVSSGSIYFRAVACETALRELIAASAGQDEASRL